MATYQRFFGTVRDAFGNPVAGASVTVTLTSDSSLATLYATTGGDSPAGLGNPVITDASGRYGFSVLAGTIFNVTIQADGNTTEYQYNLNDGKWAPLASPSLTGVPTAPTAAVDTATTQIATTAFVVNQGYLKSATALATYAPITSPTFTGTVTTPALTVTSLTPTRIPYATTGGALTDSANLTFSGSALAVTGDVDATGFVRAKNALYTQGAAASPAILNFWPNAGAAGERWGIFAANGGATLYLASATGVADWLIVDRTTGRLSVASTTASTSTTTGSLVNSGGFGNSGAGWFGGAINTSTSVVVNNAPSSGAFVLKNGGVNRWNVYHGNAETGSNAGSDLLFLPYDDAGTSLGVAFKVQRSNGNTTVFSSTASTSASTGALVVSGGLGVGGSIFCNGSLGMGINQAGAIFNDATNGLTLRGKTGSNNDVQITNNAGSQVMVVPTGTQNTVHQGANLTSHATAGMGYATGAGGTVTQTTSRSTGVTINKVSGAITLFSVAGSTTPTSFTVTNSAVAATDVILLSQQTGIDKYILLVTSVAAGSFQVTAYTTGGTTVEAPVINFAVMKAVSA